MAAQWMPPEGSGQPWIAEGGTSDSAMWLFRLVTTGVTAYTWWLWAQGKAYALEIPATNAAPRWRVRGALAAVGYSEYSNGYVDTISTAAVLGVATVSASTKALDLGCGLEDLELADGALYVIGRSAGDVVLRAFTDLTAETPAGVELYREADTGPGNRWLLCAAEGRLYRMRCGGIVDSVVHAHDQATGALLASYTLPFNLGNSPGNIMQVHGDLLAICAGSFTRTLRVLSLAALAPAAAGVGAIVEALCARVGVACDASAVVDTVPGYAVAQPQSVRAALLPLQRAFWFDLIERGAAVVAVPRGGATAGSFTAEQQIAGEAVALTRAQDLELPRRVVTVYRAVSRQYQEGSQQYQRLVGVSEAEEVIELPMALSDDRAAQCAEVLLLDAWAQRERVEFSLAAADALQLEPSDVIDLETPAGVASVRIDRSRLQPMGRVQFEAVSEDIALYTPHVGGADLTLAADSVPFRGPARLELIDGPLLRDTDPDGVAYAGAWGLLDSWPGCRVQRSADGTTWAEAGAIVTAAGVGQLLVPPSAAVSADRLDTGSAPEVELHRGTLSGVDAATFLYAPPALLMGAEVIAYRDVTDLGGGVYRLGHLLRGLRGTEQAVGAHVVGERCVLLDTALLPVPMSAADLGLIRYWRGATFGRTTLPEAASTTPVALGLLPLAPCHLTAADVGGGDWALAWVRRTRRGGAWRDAVDATLGEASERYRVEIWRAGALLSSTETTAPAATVAALADDVARVAQFSEAAGPGHYAEITL
jgi:hypothetical protein